MSSIAAFASSLLSLLPLPNPHPTPNHPTHTSIILSISPLPPNHIFPHLPTIPPLSHRPLPSSRRIIRTIRLQRRQNTVQILAALGLWRDLATQLQLHSGSSGVGVFGVVEAQGFEDGGYVVGWVGSCDEGLVSGKRDRMNLVIGGRGKGKLGRRVVYGPDAAKTALEKARDAMREVKRILGIVIGFVCGRGNERFVVR